MNRHRFLLHTASALAAYLSFFPASTGASRLGSLPELLQRSGVRMEAFLEHFSSVKCTELVTQFKLNAEGKTQQREESTFDYLAMLQVTSGELTVTESRLAQKAPAPGRNTPLLVTNGFSTLLLIFHPAYRDSFEFALLSDDVVEGRLLGHVSFRHLRGTPSPAVLLLRGRTYPLDLEGEAWIEPESGAVVRIRAGIGSGMEDVGLKRMQSDVLYRAISFQGIEAPYWLPVTATIDVETPRQHWRNVHRFTDYKHFSVATESTIQQTP